MFSFNKISYIYNPDGIHRICPISTLRVWTEKKYLEYLGQKYLGQNFGVHKQCQSKYHRNNDIPISKTCVKPSRLNIFWVLGKFWITIAKFKAIIVPTNAQASKEKEKQGQEQKRIQANTLFALKKCVYVTGRGVYPSVRLKNSFFKYNIKRN